MKTTVERLTHPHLKAGISHFWENHHSVNIEYAKYVGFILIAIGVVGLLYAGEQFLIFALTPLKSVGHLLTGMFLVASVLLFDSFYARLANQIVGPLCIIMAGCGFLGIYPVMELLSLTVIESFFYLFFGLITAFIGWGMGSPHLKH